MESNSSENPMQVVSPSVIETPAPLYGIELITDAVESLPLQQLQLLLLK